MMFRKAISLLLLLSISTLTLAKAPAKSSSSSSKGGEVRLFRYKNDQGTLVTSSSIPPEYAKRGYKIVSQNGTVIEDVPAEMSQEERQKLAESKISAAEQREKDKLMLLRYSDVGELMQARDRKLGELENKIKSQESNMTTIDNQIAAEQQNAANFERSGKEVPKSTLQKLQDLYKDQQIAQEQLKIFKETLAQDSKQFESDIARYEYLTNQHIKQQILNPPKSGDH